MRSSSPSPLAVWTGLVVLYVVWGSTFLGMKLAIDTVPPFLMIALRFVPAGLLLGAFVVIRGRGTVRRPSLREVRDASIVGALLLLCGTGLVAWSQQTIPIGVAAILIALVPMWIALFGRILFRERLPRMATVGVGVGLVGVAILAWPTGGVGDFDPAGLLALIVSPIAWALGTHYAAKRAILPEPALFGTSIQMVAAGIGSFLVAFATGELRGFDPAQVTPTSWGGIVYLITAGSFVGYTTYAWLIRVAPLSRVSTYAYVNPVVAVFLGWLVLSEPLTPRTIVASVVIIVAVVLIVTARGRASGGVAVEARRDAPEPVAPRPVSAASPAAAAPSTPAGSRPEAARASQLG
jgi:drug/metabolite transporter (DMT)-like permease